MANFLTRFIEAVGNAAKYTVPEAYLQPEEEMVTEVSPSEPEQNSETE